MNFIYIRITGKPLDTDCITETLGIKPDKTYKTGESYSLRACGNRPAKKITYDFDGWLFTIECGTIHETEHQIEVLVETLYHKKAFFQELAPLTDSMTLWVTLYQDDYQQNLHLTACTLARLAEMHFSIDITNMNL